MLARIDSYKISTVYRPDAKLNSQPTTVDEVEISARVVNNKLQAPPKRLRKRKPRKRKDSDDSDSSDSDKDNGPAIVKHKSACPLLVEYMMNSTIHGVRYFVEGSRHWIERIWWILAFFFCVSLCCWSILEVYKKSGTDPIIISIDSKLKPVTEIAFPAVTICPEAKYRGDSGFNLTTVNRLYKRDARHPHGFMSDDNTQLLIQKALTRVCHHKSAALKNNTDNSTDYVIEYIKQIALRLDDVIARCKWQYVRYNCSDLFTEVLTDEGICFTFNGVNSTNMFTDKMTADFPTFSRKQNVRRLDTNAETPNNFNATNAGLFSGLEVTLKLQQKDTDYLCRKGVTGFRIVLHPAVEMPQPSKHFFHVPLMQHVAVAVKPNIITTKSNVLYKYDEEAMRCIVERDNDDDEPKLKFFRNYTQRNCELDCLSMFMSSLNVDYHFAVPRRAHTNVTKIQDLPNYEKLMSIFYQRNYPREYCKCYPGCQSMTYDTEISYANLNLAKYNAARSSVPVDETEFHDAKLSKVSIFFKEEEFPVSKRSELYSGFELVGTIGGLLGLFMGISVLSVLEVIYYFTLRLFCISRMQKIAAKKELEEQLAQQQQLQQHVAAVTGANGQNGHII